MKTNTNHPLKTLGPQAARLVAALYDRDRRTFSLGEAKTITGLKDASARSFVRKLVDRGVAARLRPGLFVLVPFELGSERDYLGNPFVVARELMRGKPYYLSHASAMDIHQMLTQPQLVVYVTSPTPMRPVVVSGTEFHFVHCERAHVFGVTEHWVDRQEKVTVSDPERTVIDGLKLPKYCGGFTEVAKGFWMRRHDVDIDKLADYALRLKSGAVVRRLGYLLEAYGVEAPKAIARLQKRLTPSYLLLDPLLPREGRFLARWRLRVNVEPEEIQAVTRT